MTPDDDDAEVVDAALDFPALDIPALDIPALDFPAVDRFLDAQRRLLDDELDPMLVADLDPDDGPTPD